MTNREKMRLRAVIAPGLLSEREDRGSMCIKDQPTIDPLWREVTDCTGYAGSPNGPRIITSIDQEMHQRCEQ